eukprot:645783-Hanusia_phi.AAC.2
MNVLHLTPVFIPLSSFHLSCHIKFCLLLLLPHPLHALLTEPCTRLRWQKPEGLISLDGEMAYCRVTAAVKCTPFRMRGRQRSKVSTGHS